MKLQACSKLITLAIMGLTLTASGAYYSLHKAEQSLAEKIAYDNDLKLSVLQQELQQYGKRIDAEHYQFLNASLQQVLSLPKATFQLDPLLHFFDSTLRAQSAGASSKNIDKALKKIVKDQLPYVSYSFNKQDLTVHNASDDAMQQRLLSSYDSKGRSISEIAKEKPVLGQDFTILYRGNDTYLALRVYDEHAQTNYLVLSRYLTVLNNIKVGISNIFPNVAIMMHDLLNDRAAMIYGHGKVLFKTHDFQIGFDTSKLDPSMYDGIHIVDENGTILKEGQEQKGKYYLSALYLKSNNSWLFLQNTYTNTGDELAFYQKSRIGILAFALLSILALCFVGYNRKKKIETELAREAQDKDAQKKQLDKLTKQFDALTFSEFTDLVHEAAQEAHEQLYAKAEQELKEKAEAQAKLEAEEKAKAKAQAEAILAAERQNAEAQESGATTEQLSAVEKAMAATAPDAPTTAPVGQELTSTAVGEIGMVPPTPGSTVEQPYAQVENGQTTAPMAGSENGSVALPSEQTASGDTTVAPTSAHAVVPAYAQESHALVPTAEEASVPALPPQKVEDLIDADEELELTNTLLIEKFYKKNELATKPTNDDVTLAFAKNLIASSLKLSHALHKESVDSTNSTLEKHVAQIKDELKNRIALYRKEGQCLAARQMLLSALPGEDAMPTSNFVDFAAFTVPARELTGNFYTLKRLDEENLAFVIGDTDSHGVKAAYTTAVVHTLVEEALKMAMSPWDILSWINQRLFSMPHVAHVSLFIGIVSEKTGNVIGANAGHCVPIVIDNEGPHFIDDYQNPMLGVELQSGYHPIKWYLANNDMVMLYSKGILNVQNSENEIFGMPRLLAHCNTTDSADDLVIKILNDIKQHKGRRAFKQDVSLLCLKQLLIRF